MTKWNGCEFRILPPVFHFVYDQLEFMIGAENRKAKNAVLMNPADQKVWSVGNDHGHGVSF